MATTTSPSKRKPDSPPIHNPADVAKAIASVREFHAVGLRSRKNFDGRIGYRKMDAEAEGVHLHREILRNARKFALLYTREQVEEMCKLAKDHQFPLGVSYVIRLLTIPHTARPKLQNQIILGRWNWRRLNVEIMSRYGKRKWAGKRCQVPVDDAEAYFRIYRLCEQWRRLRVALQPATGKGSKAAKCGARLAQDVEKRMAKADGLIDELQQLAGKRLNPSLKHLTTVVSPGKNHIS